MKGTTTSMLLGLATVARGVHLQSRAAQSQAVCGASFSWMENSKGISPCQTAASVDAVCNNGNWVIEALNASVQYPPPQGVRASVCTCSWASYNLLSACIACQGFPEQTTQWTVFSAGCAGLTTNNFFPSNITLPQEVAIPFWAQTNPTTWPALTFSASQAQQIAAEDKPDFLGGTSTPAASTPKHKSNIGAIVGGVIGGVLVIAAAVAAALYIIRRSRKVAPPAPLGSDERPGHIRSMSDMSTFKSPMEGYSTLTGSGLMLPTSPVQTHFTGSTRSVPYMSTVAGGTSTAPYGTASPPPIPPAASNRVEDIIVPFTAPPTMDSNMDRKQAGGPYNVYDSPNAPPINAMPMDITYMQTPVRATRLNPPMYSPPTYEESSPGSSSGQRQDRRGKQDSIDTTHSLTSSRTGAGRQTTDHSPNTSISGTMPNIAGQLGVVNPGPTIPNVREGAMPQGHGRQVSASSRDTKTRPTEDSFNPRDIA